MAVGFTICNRSGESIFCSITNKTNPSGDTSWFEVRPGHNETWGRSGWEDVSFRNKDSSKRKSLWINRGEPALINFDGFDTDLVIHNDYRPSGNFLVTNHSDKVVFCTISTASGGSGDWFKLAPAGSETWARSGWETVAFKNEDDTERKGIYVSNRGYPAKIFFHGFDKDIGVEARDPSANSHILDEHYAEAVAIADRSFAAQSSRASSPGGLTASVFKVDTLERMGGGRQVSLNNHNQIYTLALLINHLKYGLTDPAVVVSITADWVKVAAYTCEFDTIVVLGFPTKTIDIVAPGQQRPAIGKRLIAISQFTYRDANKPGVLGDITMGPRTYNKWYNFHPLVAQFTTDDSQAPIWQERLAAVDENLWGRVWEEWLAWKARHGENYFRLGIPSKITLIATNHN